MLCVNNCFRLYFLLCVHLLFVGFLCCQKATQSTNSAKYYEQIQKTEESLDSSIAKAEKLEQKYASDEFINKFVNAEKIRIEKQEQFNNKILFGVNLPINESGVQVNVYNRDLMLLGVAAGQWGIEFVLFKLLAGILRGAVLDLSLQQPVILSKLLKDLDRAIQEKNEEQIKHNARELEKFVGSSLRKCWPKYLCANVVFSLAANIIHQTQDYYLLNSMFKQNLIDFAFMMFLHKTSSVPIDDSLTSFLSDKSIAGLPFDLVQTTVLDMLTSFLCQYGLIPDWVTGNKFDLVRRITFTGIFIWWAQRNIYKPIILNYLVSVRKDLILELDKINVGDLDVQKQAEQNLKNILNNLPQCSFALWETNMRKNFAQWQTILNLVLLTPAVFKIGRWIYDLNKQANNQ